jgi:hypothetical protein
MNDWRSHDESADDVPIDIGGVQPRLPSATNVIDVTDGVTSIEVSPDEIPFRLNGSAGISPQRRVSGYRPVTGARVTVEFSRVAPVPPNRHVRVYYDIAENGGLREIVGIPQITHTTACQGRPGRSYHYRLSHWIVAPSVMRFIPPQYAAGLTARRASSGV